MGVRGSRRTVRKDVGIFFFNFLRMYVIWLGGITVVD